MEKMEVGLSIRRITDYEPEDGVFALDDAGIPGNVPFAFKLDDGRWVDFPDAALPPVLNLLGATDLEQCVGKVVELSTAATTGAVELQPGVFLVGLA